MLNVLRNYNLLIMTEMFLPEMHVIDLVNLAIQAHAFDPT